MQNFYESDSPKDFSYDDFIIDTNAKNKVLGKTFFWMFLGLLGSGFTYSLSLLYSLLLLIFL